MKNIRASQNKVKSRKRMKYSNRVQSLFSMRKLVVYKNINKYKPLFVQAIFRTRTECPELNANSALSAGGGALTYAKNVADDSEESTPPAGPLPQG